MSHSAKSTAAISLFSIVMCGNSLADSVMAPGAWEMVTSVQIQEPSTERYETATKATTMICLTAQFLETDPYLTPGMNQEKMRERQAKCSTSDEVKGKSKSSWTMSCTLANGMTIAAEISNSASSHQLTSIMHQKASMEGQSRNMKIETQGAHKGACSEGMMTP